MSILITGRKMLAASAVAVVAALASGCSMGGMDMGGMDMSGPSAQGGQKSAVVQRPAYNKADLKFARDMYAHDAQAVTMAGYVKGRTTNRAVVILAEQIRAAGSSEMNTIETLLARWRQPAPSTDPAEAGSATREGLFSDGEIAALQTLSGPQFDREWLSLMVDHHNGAVATAQRELQYGRSLDAKKLARQSVDTQRAGAATMNRLLN